MRFFFDYTTKDQSLYDYEGNEFRNSQSAIEFAEAMTQFLRDGLTSEWSGWSVEVRDAEGKKFFSSPVGSSASIAA